MTPFKTNPSGSLYRAVPYTDEQLRNCAECQVYICCDFIKVVESLLPRETIKCCDAAGCSLKTKQQILAMDAYSLKHRVEQWLVLNNLLPEKRGHYYIHPMSLVAAMAYMGYRVKRKPTEFFNHATFIKNGEVSE